MSTCSLVASNPRNLPILRRFKACWDHRLASSLPTSPLGASAQSLLQGRTRNHPRTRPMALLRNASLPSPASSSSPHARLLTMHACRRYLHPYPQPMGPSLHGVVDAAFGRGSRISIRRRRMKDEGPLDSSNGYVPGGM